MKNAESSTLMPRHPLPSPYRSSPARPSAGECERYNRMALTARACDVRTQSMSKPKLEVTVTCKHSDMTAQ
eukprot:11749-Heterococcus_DN1.PRE.2